MEAQYPVSALLFQSSDDEESLVVACQYDASGLHVFQVSAGELTQWCFEESPHTVSVSVDPSELGSLLAYLRVPDAALLPPLLAAAYGGYDAAHRVRGLLRRLHIPYKVDERPIAR